MSAINKNIAAVLDAEAFLVPVQFKAASAVYHYVYRKHSRITGKLLPQLMNSSKVIVRTVNGLQVAEVVAPEITGVLSAANCGAVEPDAEFKYQWIAGVIDTSEYDALVEHNKKVESVTRELVTNSARESFRNAVLAGLSNEGRQLLLETVGGAEAEEPQLAKQDPGANPAPSTTSKG
jgi:hypothetical protein